MVFRLSQLCLFFYCFCELLKTSLFRIFTIQCGNPDLMKQRANVSVDTFFGGDRFVSGSNVMSDLSNSRVHFQQVGFFLKVIWLEIRIGGELVIRLSWLFNCYWYCTGYGLNAPFCSSSEGIIIVIKYIFISLQVILNIII